MFVKFQASSVNLAHVLHASIMPDGSKFKFQIQFVDGKELIWQGITRAQADQHLAEWMKLVCPAPVDFLSGK
jgi:hypothetical protein